MIHLLVGYSYLDVGVRKMVARFILKQIEIAPGQRKPIQITRCGSHTVASDLQITANMISDISNLV